MEQISVVGYWRRTVTEGEFLFRWETFHHILQVDRNDPTIHIKGIYIVFCVLQQI